LNLQFADILGDHYCDQGLEKDDLKCFHLYWSGPLCKPNYSSQSIQKKVIKELDSVRSSQIIKDS